MATRTASGAEGSMKLINKWYESSSTHIEVDSNSILKGKDDYVELLETSEETNFYKLGSKDRSESLYRIKTTDLIKLIKENVEALL